MSGTKLGIEGGCSDGGEKGGGGDGGGADGGGGGELGGGGLGVGGRGGGRGGGLGEGALKVAAMQSRSNMRYGTSQSWSYTSCGHEGSGEAEWRPSGKDTGVVHSGTQPWVQRMAAGRTAYEPKGLQPKPWDAV